MFTGYVTYLSPHICLSKDIWETCYSLSSPINRAASTEQTSIENFETVKFVKDSIQAQGLPTHDGENMLLFLPNAS